MIVRKFPIEHLDPVNLLGQNDSHLRQIERSGNWQDSVLPALSAMITGVPQQLRLAPTARSLLR